MASVVMGGVVFAWIVGWHQVAGDSLWHQVIEVTVAIALAVPVYASLLWILRIDGRDEVLLWIKARRGAKKA